MLVVETPPGHEAERDWVLGVIFEEFLGISHRRSTGRQGDVRITAADGSPGALRFPDVLFGRPEGELVTAAALPEDPRRRTRLDDLPEAGLDDLPLLYTSERMPASVTADGDELVFGADPFGTAFLMLSRLEEHLPGRRDAHGRFPSQASVAARGGFLERPVVNEYLEVLFAMLRRVWPRLERRRRSYTVIPSHDVDYPLIAAGRGALGIARRMAGDIALRRSPELAIRTALAGLTRSQHFDPAYTFDFLMQVSERHELRSEFNFLCGLGASEFDGDYRLDDPCVTNLMDTVHRRGHAIGFHPSYLTHDDNELIRREFDTLRTAVERRGITQDLWGGRQHYLRWSGPVTWRGWEDAGLDYDATLGFADHVGFRCGVCFPFPAFDLEQRRPLRLIERPLTVMDNTLTDYMGLSPAQGIARAESVAASVRRFDGEFQLLWHNSQLLTRRQQRDYAELIEAVSP